MKSDCTEGKVHVDVSYKLSEDERKGEECNLEDFCQTLNIEHNVILENSF